MLRAGNLLLSRYASDRELSPVEPGDEAGLAEVCFAHGWYREAIPLADERFTQHLTELVAEESRKR